MTATAAVSIIDDLAQSLDLERELSDGGIPSSTCTKFPSNPRLAQVFSEEFIPGIVDGTGGIISLPLQQGGRPLTPVDDLWTQNAWDKVEWGQEQEEIARIAIAKQMSNPVALELQQEYNANPASYWDEFYSNVKDRFFNDRAWLRTEFPELADAVKPDAGSKVIVELGCGPGNTLFPLLSANENPDLRLHGYDFSKEAIDLVKLNPAYESPCIYADVWSLASTAGLPGSLAPGSVDIAIMIFVLSALHPDEWATAAKNAWTMLKPGGILLLRDYGRNDMAQLRFKANRLMSPGFYVRGDHTRVYFFEKDDLIDIFGGGQQSPSLSSSLGSLSLSSTDLPPTPPIPTTPASATTTTPLTPTAPARTTAAATAPYRLNLLQVGIDRRLLLNRKLQLKMYRVWLQGRWQKSL